MEDAKVDDYFVESADAKKAATLGLLLLEENSTLVDKLEQQKLAQKELNNRCLDLKTQLKKRELQYRVLLRESLQRCETSSPVPRPPRLARLASPTSSLSTTSISSWKDEPQHPPRAPSPTISKSAERLELTLQEELLNTQMSVQKQMKDKNKSLKLQLDQKRRNYLKLESQLLEMQTRDDAAQQEIAALRGKVADHKELQAHFHEAKRLLLSSKFREPVLGTPTPPPPPPSLQPLIMPAMQEENEDASPTETGIWRRFFTALFSLFSGEPKGRSGGCTSPSSLAIVSNRSVGSDSVLAMPPLDEFVLCKRCSIFLYKSQISTHGQRCGHPRMSGRLLSETFGMMFHSSKQSLLAAHPFWKEKSVVLEEISHRTFVPFLLDEEILPQDWRRWMTAMTALELVKRIPELTLRRRGKRWFVCRD